MKTYSNVKLSQGINYTTLYTFLVSIGLGSVVFGGYAISKYVTLNVLVTFILIIILILFGFVVSTIGFVYWIKNQKNIDKILDIDVFLKEAEKQRIRMEINLEQMSRRTEENLIYESEGEAILTKEKEGI